MESCRLPDGRVKAPRTLCVGVWPDVVPFTQMICVLRDNKEIFRLSWSAPARRNFLSKTTSGRLAEIRNHLVSAKSYGLRGYFSSAGPQIDSHRVVTE